MFLLSERCFVSNNEPLSTIPRARISLFLFIQVFAVAATVAISQTLGAIGFPVLITALIPFRWLVMPSIFSAGELAILDALTADNPAVLASLGGKPDLPETKRMRRPRGSSAGAQARRPVEKERETLRLARERESARTSGMEKSGNSSSTTPAMSQSSPAETVNEASVDTGNLDNLASQSREERKEEKRDGKRSADRQRIGTLHR